MVKGEYMFATEVEVLTVCARSLQARKGAVKFGAGGDGRALTARAGRDRAAGPPGGQEGRHRQAERRGHKGEALPARHRRRHRALPAQGDQAHGRQEAREEEQGQAFHQGALC